MSEKTLIEFFDHESLENVVSLTGGAYTQVFYLYFTDLNVPTEQEQAILTSFISRRLGARTDFIHVPEASLDGVCRVFDRLVAENGPCRIDLTGGSSLFITAAGYYAARSDRVTLQQFDTASGKRIFCHPEDAAAPGRLTLSVPEFISLHRASLLEDSPQLDEAYFTGGLEREILRLWNTVRDIPQDWNKFCTLPAFTPADLRVQEEKCLSSSSSRLVYEKVMGRLRRQGMVGPERTVFFEDQEYRTFSLTVPEWAKFLYQQGGNLLEMYCALSAVRSGLFRDCRSGVLLDWNGREECPASNVKNEVDVILTRNHRPILISCKNTAANNQYLYEISIMARHYGGRYAQAMLVSNAGHSEPIRARAQEMGVVLIDRVSRLSQAEFISLLDRHTAPSL